MVLFSPMGLSHTRVFECKEYASLVQSHAFSCHATIAPGFPLATLGGIPGELQENIVYE